MMSDRRLFAPRVAAALRALDARLSRIPRSAVAPVAALGSLFVGLLDYLTGYEVSMSLFYLGPVAFATWYGPRRQLAPIALLASLCREASNVAAGMAYSSPLILAWNVTIGFLTFFVVQLALASLHENLARQTRLARTDSLTGLYTRREFHSRLEQCFALARRTPAPLTVAVLDVDDFKRINDSLGHAEGDRVLGFVGAVLRAMLRESDTAARIGGDEFALLLPGTDAEGARVIVERIVARIADPAPLRMAAVRVSIGVLTVASPAVAHEQALRAADDLMYAVKRGGKGGVGYRTVDAD